MAKKEYPISLSHQRNGVSDMVPMSAVVGDGIFGIHRSLDSKKDWTVTHLPTGYKMADLGLKRTAVGCAENLLAEVGDVDWRESDPERLQAEPYRDAMQDAYRIIMHWQRRETPMTREQARNWTENWNPLG